MPPDWRLFHVRRSTGKRLFIELPLSSLLREPLLKKQQEGHIYANCIMSNNAIQIKKRLLFPVLQ